MRIPMAFALILVILFTGGVITGCGGAEESELVTEQNALDKLTDLSIECPSCRKRFLMNVYDFNKVQESREKSYCPHCGAEFQLSKKHSHRFGKPNKAVKVGFKVFDRKGKPRTPWVELVRKYNNLEGTRFDRLTNEDIKFSEEEEGKYVARDPGKEKEMVCGPYKVAKLPEECEKQYKEVSVERPRMKRWFFEQTYADEHNITSGIAGASETLPDPVNQQEVPMYRFDHNVETYVLRVDSEESDTLKPILAPPCMEATYKFIKEAEGHFPKRPDQAFLLEGISDQESVLRFANRSRDSKSDPVRYEFHLNRTLEGYNRDKSGTEKVVEKERTRLKTFHEVKLPDYWNPQWKPENPDDPVYRSRLWSTKEYVQKANDLVGDKEAKIGKKPLLTILKEERRDANEAWERRSDAAVIQATALLVWVDERTADLTMEKEIKKQFEDESLEKRVSALDGNLRNIWLEREMKRNRYFSDVKIEGQEEEFPEEYEEEEVEEETEEAGE